MSSFFTTPASQRKRKRPETGEGTVKPRKRQDVERARGGGKRIKPSAGDGQRPVQGPQPDRDESISGSDTEDEAVPESAEESDVTSEEGETGAERRVRLAQRYLDRIKGEVDEAGFDAEDLDNDIIARRLKDDVDEAKGRQFRLIANTLDVEKAEHINFRADTQSTTAVAVCKPYLYTVSKDKALIKWQIQPPDISPYRESHSIQKKRGHDGVKRKPHQVAFVKGVKLTAAASQQQGHTGAILSLAVSPDGRFVATGGADKKLIIWSAEDLRPLKTFYTHRDAVTGLDFAPIPSASSGFGLQLFSSSMDRSIKTYSLAGEDSIAYVETLFGHQDHVLAVSAVSQDQCVSVGARDRSARWWKVVDETQLKFLGDSSRSSDYQTGSLDCVAALPPNHFVTGSDSGAIQLWSMHKKKSLFTIQTAHGVDPLPEFEQVTSEIDPKVIEDLKRSDKRRPTPRAITALAALPGTDVIVSGSWDGYIRIWKLSDDKRILMPLDVLGRPADQHGVVEPIHTIGLTNGDHQQPNTVLPLIGSVRGIVNSLAVFERRKETTDEFGGTKEGDCLGLCVIAGVGKETRLGRWLKPAKGRNGTVLFEVAVKQQNAAV